MNQKTSRRQFVTTGLSAAAICGSVVNAQQSDGTPNLTSRPLAPARSSSTSQLRIQPRYHRWHVDPGIEWIETHTAYANLDWTIPFNQVAVVLVDVWDHHYLLDTEHRIEQVICNALLPLLTACRAAQLPIIHAPSMPIAKQHPNWIRLDTLGSAKHDPQWPPPNFRSKQGEFRAYSRPTEPREPELVRLRAERKLHPKVQPLAGEPVVGTGEELHRYCKQEGILFLLFAGFNTNACVLVNDYGTLAMSQRGYEVILIRDCTTGMESRESQPTMSQTNGAVLFLEMFGKYSITSGEVINGLKV